MKKIVVLLCDGSVEPQDVVLRVNDLGATHQLRGNSAKLRCGESAAERFVPILQSEPTFTIVVDSPDVPQLRSIAAAATEHGIELRVEFGQKGNPRGSMGYRAANWTERPIEEFVGSVEGSDD